MLESKHGSELFTFVSVKFLARTVLTLIPVELWVEILPCSSVSFVTIYQGGIAHFNIPLPTIRGIPASTGTFVCFLPTINNQMSEGLFIKCC